MSRRVVPEHAQNARQYGNLSKLKISENPAAPVAKHGEPFLKRQNFLSSICQTVYLYLTKPAQEET